MNLKFLWAPLAGCFLTACNTPMPPYVVPASGQMATVRFIDRENGANVPVIYARGEPQGCGCSADPVEGIGVFHNKALLVPGHDAYADKGQDVSEFVVKVRADGTPFRFIMSLPSSNLTEKPGYVVSTYCQAHESFIPIAGETYEVTHDPAQAKCHMSVQVVHGDSRSDVATTNYPLCAMRSDNSDGVSDSIRNVCHAHPEIYTH